MTEKTVCNYMTICCMRAGILSMASIFCWDRDAVWRKREQTISCFHVRAAQTGARR